MTSDADPSDGPKLISASGVWDEPRHEPRHDPQVRPAAQLKPVDPFDDPFGDQQIAQQPRSVLHQPDPMPIQPPTTDELPAQPRPLVQPGRDFLPQPVPDDSAPERLPQPKDPQDCQEDKNCETGIYPVTGISLDITPPLETNIRDIDVDPAQRKQFYLDPNYMGDLRVRGGLSNESRVWYGRNGQRLADGRLVDFAHDKIVIEQANGRQTTVRFQQLSEDDLCYVTSWWRLPNECLLGDEQYAGRAFIPSTYTWTASALCHKPLYFEDIQLERYGHSTGPFVQPFKSAAHFFVNIAVSPYKIGINPPHECQYALGYYRPGDCAPWLIEPVPVSLRGAALQATAVVGGIYLIP